MFVLQEPAHVEPQSEETVLPERVWRTPNELDKDLMDLASSHDMVTVTTIGHSRNGHPIRRIQIGRKGVIPIKDRSAILIVAGIDGDHLIGSEVAADMIEELLSRDSDETKTLFEDHVLFIIPQVNPDAAKMYFASVQNGQHRNMRPVDDDHDGSFDEDGTEDLNGDGLITMMRVPNLEKATHLVDPDEPRLDVKPDPLEGQASAYHLYTEGIDNDGDGEYNEDGIGGVDLNKNFMHGYKYHGDGAGPWQLSEPESMALIKFVLDNQHIAAIIVYGQHDTLSKPLGEGGKDPAGAPKKLNSGDVDMYKKISERFVELTSLKSVNQPNWDGSFVAWAYAQFGVPAFSTPLWSCPELTKDEEESSDKDTTADEDESSDQELKSDDDGGSERHVRPNRGRRPGGGARSGGGFRPNQDQEESSDSSEESDTSNLTPSGVGDISQETLDELFEAAEAAGFPVTDEMMADITPERLEQFAKMSGITIRRVKSDKKDSKSTSKESKWLEYSDQQRNGEGFIEWTPFEHPQLGTVEIGGWVPYFKILPPTTVIKDTTKVQADFVLDLADRLPKVYLETPIVKQLSNGMWEIKVAVINDGWLPSGTAMAKQNRRARPYVIRLDVPNDSIITGQKVNRIWSLSGGGTREWFRWIIQGTAKSSVKIILFSDKFGTETITISLQDTNGGDA